MSYYRPDYMRQHYEYVNDMNRQADFYNSLDRQRENNRIIYEDNQKMNEKFRIDNNQCSVNKMSDEELKILSEFLTDCINYLFDYIKSATTKIYEVTCSIKNKVSGWFHAYIW